jgi:mRNA turnover protein 4
MPKSKRAKVVHLSKVGKKGKEHSDKIFNGVRDAADEYPYIYIFRVENMRNNYLKDIRAELGDSKYATPHTKSNPHGLSHGSN